jgi:hypothetical protein
LEDTVKHRTRHTARERISVGVLHLPSDFDFADHLRLKTRDDGEEVFNGLQSWHRTEMLVERGRGCARSLEQGAAQVKRGGFVADSIRLETIASREQDRFSEPGLASGRIEDFGSTGRHRKRGALIEAGGAMCSAQRHQIAGTFAHRDAGSER